VVDARAAADERVSWKADSHANLLPQLDKTNPGLTHVPDALGYLMEAEFGLRPSGGPPGHLPRLMASIPTHALPGTHHHAITLLAVR
jgi:hypothetical protein